MPKQYIECGKIVTTHGLQGELKVQPWCDYPEFLEEFERFYLEEGKTLLEVATCRIHKGMGLIRFKGYDTIESVAPLRNKVLYINRDDDQLAEGDYYIQDLIGLEVYDIDSKELYGKLTEVSPTGANDVYHILFADGKEHLIPAIPQVVLSVDMVAGRMEIRPLEGLFDDED